MTAYCQLSSRTYDRGSVANPRALPNPDRAATCNTLLNDGDFDIFVRVIVVHNQNLLSNVHIAL
jgi:hypothetical protein